MNDLFLLLCLASLACLVVGLIKPTAFSKLTKEPITRGKVFLIFAGATVAFFILFGITTKPEIDNATHTTADQKESKILWDIPALIGKTHNQIVEALGNPTMVEKLSNGKIERFKFVSNKMESFFQENLPARIGMKTTIYNIYYKKSDCGMMTCGNDLNYSYINADQPIKYFFISNYPVEAPTSSVEELKQMGNLDNSTTIKVVPALMYDNKSVYGIDICAEGYRGSEFEEGSENCLK